MNKKLKIVGAVVLAALLIVGIIYLITKQEKTGEKTPGEKLAEVTSEMLENQTSEAAEETTKLVNEVIADLGTSTTQTINVTIPGKEGEEGATTTVKAIQVVTIAEGSSPIDINSGKVVTETGEAVKNDIEPASPEAPRQSFPMDAADAPASAIKLQVTSNSFTPNTFTVNRGQAVNLVVSNVNESTFSEIFRFDDASLSAVVLGLAKGETKSITFNAPTKAGEYIFFSSMFDHRDQGAVGKMIVK